LRQAETTRTVNLLKEVDVAVIGAGPAGLAAALACAEAGVSTLLIDGNDAPGGQLVKQTHKFFGSERQHAGTRGIQIPDIFTGKLADYPNVEIMWNTNASGFYDSGELVIEDEKRFMKILPKRVIVATGASERFLMFRNNDLPGVYGAGAVQTLMNVYGVVPGDRVLMVGSGNIGLIVSYQLIQAGVEVAAVIEAAPCIGGYLVHAAKLRRAGVPILTSHTILAASGEESVTGATIARVDKDWQAVPGTERVVKCDVICLAVGLMPLVDVLWQAGCEMKYVPELGGHVPVRDENMRTSNSRVYAAGDSGGVEEASSAMVTGEIAGISAAKSLGHQVPGADERLAQLKADLAAIRSGPAGEKISAGVRCATVCGGVWG
jgi:sarcosine oxidase subunit alpha